MSEDKFDCIIVGAGPAGTSAAITAAKAGLKTVVLERGEYPGAKNVQGAIFYTKMLADILPEFWKDAECPMERPITEQRMWLMSDDAALQFGFKSDKWRKEPHNCYSVIRVHFDRWYAKKAEEAGAEIYTGVMVSDVIKKDGKICGVKTSEGDELLGDVVIAADGVNSILAQKAGLMDEWKPEEVALGVKEILELPKEKIEDRFNLENGEGATIEMFGKNTAGMMGYSFIYTNKETLSLGLGCKVSHFMKTGLTPYELLDKVKAHPMVRRLIQGSKVLEYSAHMIPEGGYHSMPPLYSDGLLIAGDAAQMINPTHREGSNHAMAAGRMAAETVIEAKKKGDFSKKALSLYKKKIDASFIMPDLYEIRDLENEAEKRPELFTICPELACQAALDFFTVDGRPKEAIYKQIFQRFSKSKDIRRMALRELKPSNLLKTAKIGFEMAKKIVF